MVFITHNHMTLCMHVMHSTFNSITLYKQDSSEGWRTKGDKTASNKPLHTSSELCGDEVMYEPVAIIILSSFHTFCANITYRHPYIIFSRINFIMYQSSLQLYKQCCKLIMFVRIFNWCWIPKNYLGNNNTVSQKITVSRTQY